MTLAAVRAAAAKYPYFHIIHFDAHVDLRDDYLGAKLSHACVFEDAMKFWEMAISISSVSEVGREKNFSLLPEHTDFHPFTFEGLEETVRNLKRNRFQYILPLIWIVWIHPYFREQVLRRREV